MKMLHTANNKQNQLPENLSLDKNVDGWAVWFCLLPLPTIIKIDNYHEKHHDIP